MPLKSAFFGAEKHVKAQLEESPASWALVEVTGFEPATFWSRSKLSSLHYMQININNTLITMHIE